MKKLRLELDGVKVESFEIARPTELRGTVRGKETGQWTCYDMGCNTGITAVGYCPTDEAQSCPGYTCNLTEGVEYNTCGGTCTARFCTVCDMAC